MLKRILLAAVVAAVSAGPALAQGTCGALPIAPALPTPAEIQQKSPADALAANHNGFKDIKRWQADLKDYRSCLDSQTNSDKRDLSNAQGESKPDQDKIKGIQAEIAQTSQSYDASVDAEEHMVNEFHAMLTAYCMRKDVDRTSCPK